MKNHKFFFIFLFLLVICLIFDFCFVVFFHTNPVFAIQTQSKTARVYLGLGYQVHICAADDFGNEKFLVAPLFQEVICDEIKEPTNQDFIILDKTTNTASAMELFYEDPYYQYYFPYEQSNSTFLQFATNETLTVKEALEKEKVTIDDLLEENLNILKVPRFSLELVPNHLSESLCTPKLLMEYGLSKVYSYCDDEIYLNLNGQHLPLEEALQEEIITMDDIVYATNYGYLYGDGTREIIKQGGPMIFRNQDYSLLKCSMKEGYNAYIGDSKLKYHDTLCQS